jgi:hypothetical protein
VHDDERHTVKITLRLEPELADRFRALQAVWGPCTLGDVLEGLLDQADDVTK